MSDDIVEVIGGMEAAASILDEHDFQAAEYVRIGVERLRASAQVGETAYGEGALYRFVGGVFEPAPEATDELRAASIELSELAGLIHKGSPESEWDDLIEANERFRAALALSTPTDSEES